MISLSSADQHSNSCTETSQKAMEISFLPPTDQINVQIEKLKKLVSLYMSSMKNTIWESLFSLMEEIQAYNQTSYSSLLNLRRLLNSIKMLIKRYKGPSSGLLCINSIDTLAQEKYRLLVASYKEIYSKDFCRDSLTILKGALSIARSSCQLSPIEKNNPDKNINPIFQLSPDSNSTSFIKRINIDDTLKRQFYYKCQIIKRRLGRKHQGYWVESSPLFNYAKTNKIAISDWEKFIEQELTQNPSSWIGTHQLAALKKPFAAFEYKK